MSARSSASLAVLLKQLQTDLSAVMGQKSGTTSSDLPRTILSLLDKFTETQRAKHIGKQDILTVISVINFTYEKIPHIIGTRFITLSLIQKSIKLLTVLGDKNRAASANTLSIIIKLPMLLGGEIRRSLLRDLLHGAMELLLDAEQQLTNLSLSSKSTPVTVDLFSNLWDWPESNEPPLELPLSTRPSCLHAASIAASLLSSLVQSQPFVLGPCVPHIIAPALIQSLVSGNDLNEQACFMEALQKLLAFVPSSSTQIDSGPQGMMPVVTALLDTWHQGQVLSDDVSDLTEARTADASRWLIALSALTTTCLDTIPGEIRALYAEPLFARLSKACTKADSIISSLNTSHPLQPSLSNFQASICYLLLNLLGSCAKVDRLHHTDLSLLLGLSHLKDAQECLSLVLRHFLGNSSAAKGLLAELEARGFKTVAHRIISRPPPENLMANPGPSHVLVIENDDDDAMFIEERPALNANPSLNNGPSTAATQKKRMRQTQISFGEGGKGLSTQLPASSRDLSMHSSGGQKVKKRALGGSKGTPRPQDIPQGATATATLSAPAFSPRTTISSLPDASGPSGPEDDIFSSMIPADLKASAAALVTWLLSLYPPSSEDTSSTKSLLSLSGVLNVIQSAYDNSLLDAGSSCNCCPWSPLFDLLSSILSSWVKRAATQMVDQGDIIKLLDSFVRLLVNRIAAKKPSCDCSPGCIIGETDIAIKTTVDMLQSAQLMIDSKDPQGSQEFLLSIAVKILIMAAPSLRSLSTSDLSLSSENAGLFAACIVPILDAFSPAGNSLAITHDKDRFLSACRAAINKMKSQLSDGSCLGNQSLPIQDAALILSTIIRLAGCFSMQELAIAIRPITSRLIHAVLQDVCQDQRQEEDESNGPDGANKPLITLPFSEFGPLLEVFLSASVSSKTLSSEEERAVLLLFRSVSWYLECSQSADLSGSGSILRHLLPLLGSPLRLIQRLASLTLLPALLQPAPLYEAFGSPEDRSVAGAEKRLLSDLRTRLENDDKEMTSTSNGNISCAILEALTVSVENGRLRSGSRIEAMLMAVGCLGVTDPTVREAAASALTRICKVGSTIIKVGPEALRHALLKSSASNRVLEFVGRNVSDRPSLLLELSRLLGHGADTQPLAQAVVPNIIGWLCVHQKKRELLVLADILVNLPLNDQQKIQQLFLSYVGQAVAYTFWVENDSIQPFIDFVEVIVAPDSFLKIGKVASREIAIEVIKMSGLPSEWTQGQGQDGTMDQIQIEPSTEVVERCQSLLGILLNIMGRDPKEPVGKLITGHVSTILLKSIGSLFVSRHAHALMMAQHQQHPLSISGFVGQARDSGSHQAPSGGSLSHQGSKRGRLYTQASGLEEDDDLDGEGDYEDPQEAHKLQALRALSVMIILLKEHVVNNLPQFMSVLSAGLKDASSVTLKLQALGTWRVFIRSLAECSGMRKSTHSSSTASSSPLSRVAQQAVIVIMETLEDFDARSRRSAEVESLAVRILEEIIIEHSSILRATRVLARMPPLPSLPSLARVNLALAKEQGREADPKRHLRILINSLRSDNVDVRLVAVGELHLFLQSHRALIMSSASSLAASRPLTTPSRSFSVSSGVSSASGDQEDQEEEDARGPDLLSATLSALLRCCDNVMRTPQGKKLRLKCADCLGVLGAVDPSRVVIPRPPPEPLIDPLAKGGSALNLEVHLIQKHLLRLLETADSIAFLEFATYSVQSLLQIYAGGISSQGVVRARPANGDNVLFSTLLPVVQEVVKPLLFTRFTLEESGNQNLRKTSCRRWLELWLKSLSKSVMGPHQAALTSVSSVFKFDQRVMNFLLPHAVLNILIFGSEQAQKDLRIEIDSVLTAASISSLPSGTNPEEAVPELELCLQTIFTLFDILGRWHKDSQEQLAIFSLQLDQALRQQAYDAHQMGDASYSSPTVKSLQGSISQLTNPSQKVHSFLESIKKKDLAMAAFKCGAYARALKYYESFVRLEGGALNPSSHKSLRTTYKQEHISFLLEIYGQLEEPDGLQGLVQLKRDGLMPGDQIKVAEKVGSWGEALALYETQLSLQIGSNTHITSPSPSSSQAPLATDSLDESQCLELGRMRCLLSLGHLQGLLHQVNGLMSVTDPTAKGGGDLRQRIAALGVAGSWRLGRWDALESYLAIAEGARAKNTHPSSSSFSTLAASDSPSSVAGQNEHLDVCIGRLLLSMHQERYDVAKVGLSSARSDILAVLPAISHESYVRAYPLVARLHVLQEIEDVLMRLEGLGDRPASNKAPSAAAEMRQRWKERLDIAQGSLSIQEPLLAVRRQLAEIFPGLQDEVGVTWLQYAKLCRSTGHPEAASTAVLEAATRGAPGAALEKAKLLWDQGKEHRAIVELKTALVAFEDPKHRIFGKISSDGRRMHAKVALKLAKWTAEEGQMGYLDLKGLFDSAIKVDERWERGYFEYGLYLDALYLDAKKRQQAAAAGNTSGSSSSKSGSGKGVDRLNGQSRVTLGEERAYYELLPDVLQYYGKAVELGSKHALHALPRIVTLYCDWGIEQNGNLVRKGGIHSKERSATTQVTNQIKELASKLPSTSWLLVLPQLISRICHPLQDVAEVIQSILVRVALAFPQQVLWSMAAVCKSKVDARQRAANGIISAARKAAANDPAAKKVFDQFFPLLEQLVKLCFWVPKDAEKDKNKPMPKDISANQEFAALVKLLPISVMVPNQSAFSSPLPPLSSSSSSSAAAAGDSCTLVTISGLEDKVPVMQSMQKPKKISFRGSDGLSHPFLAKPKDDLRKDYRLMDFAGMLNQLFSKGAATRRRNLRIRTYAVLPLTEDCGILQWINNLTSFKGACEDVMTSEGTYKRKEFALKVKTLFEEWPSSQSRARLLDKVLSTLPPMMHRWFIAKFPEPASWLQARLNFTRTNAVWCMTGHMLGLGDRHGENILLDTTCGDTVQVDFGCLFDKGLTLAVPEMVPFRLTQNVIDSFGITGVEGTFRKCAEITLQVLRSNKEMFMTSAETFLYDPLVDWSAAPGGSKSGGGGQGGSVAEIENPAAKDALLTIQGRLSGTLLGVLSQPSLPLSCEGHAQRLISEATDKEKLGSMYIWWQAWL